MMPVPQDADRAGPRTRRPRRPGLVRRLVVDGRPAHDAAVGEAEPGPVPRALEAAVDDGPLVQRPAGVGARAWSAWTVSPIRTTTRSLMPARILVGVASGSAVEVRDLAGVELDPLRAGARGTRGG